MGRTRWALVMVALVMAAPAATAQPSPPPDALWAPDPTALPDRPTFVYLESTTGEYYADGETARFPSHEARITVRTEDDGGLTVGVEGDEYWTGSLELPEDQGRFREGYYGDLATEHSEDAAGGWLWWHTGLIPCPRTFGWIAVDDIAYEAGRLTRLRVRFEQRCGESDAPPLHGVVAYDHRHLGPAYNPQPDPGDLWRPAAGATPQDDWYVHLEGGNYVASEDVFTRDNATISVTADVRHVAVLVATEDSHWEGQWAVPDGYAVLRKGYYADLQRFPFHNPVKGGLDISSFGRGCNKEFGWFVVDEVTYDGLALTSLALRFEHRCEYADGSPLYGEVRWTAEDQLRSGPSYSDVADEPHREAIQVLSDAGIVGGYPDGTFRPRRVVTRGQMATFIARALGIRPRSESPTFDDTQGHPHYEGIQAVADAFIVSGYEDRTFRPDLPVRRDQMATFLKRAFRFWERDGGGEFPDVTRNAHRDSIAFVAEAGVATGHADGTYRPARGVARGQMAAFIHRAMTR